MAFAKKPDTRVALTFQSSLKLTAVLRAGAVQILITAYADDALTENVKRANIQHVIRKPFIKLFVTHVFPLDKAIEA